MPICWNRRLCMMGEIYLYFPLLSCVTCINMHSRVFTCTYLYNDRYIRNCPFTCFPFANASNSRSAALLETVLLALLHNTSRPTVSQSSSSNIRLLKNNKMSQLHQVCKRF